MKESLLALGQDVWMRVRALPLLQTLMFLVLLTITINRRRLSSNHEYRIKSQGRERNQEQNVRFKSESFIRRRPLLARLWMFLRRLFRIPPTSSLPPAKDVSSDGSVVNSPPSGSGLNSVTAATATVDRSALSPLTPEMLMQVLAYLSTADVVRLALTSRTRYEEGTSNFVWEQLWIQTYSAIWRNPRIKEIRHGKGVFWDPLENFGPPQAGWFRFYLAFEACWIDWILAGYCTSDKCFVAIDGAILDVSDFLPEHPGSPETLSEGAGCDATDSFYDIGHSTHAEKLMRRFIIWDYREPSKLIRDETVRQMPRVSPLHVYLRHIQKKIVQLAGDHLVLKQPLMGVNMNNISDIVDALPNSLPNMPQLPSMPSLPQMPQLPSMPSLPQLPNLPSMPQLPNLSSLSNLPAMPTLPSLPSMLPTQFLGSIGANVAVTNQSDNTAEDNTTFTTVAPDTAETSPELLVDTDAAPLSSMSTAEDPSTAVKSPKKRLSVFGTKHATVPELGGYLECPEVGHSGMLKAYFDPLSAEWTVWCSCCGFGYPVLIHTSSEDETVASWIFS